MKKVACETEALISLNILPIIKHVFLGLISIVDG